VHNSFYFRLFFFACLTLYERVRLLYSVNDKQMTSEHFSLQRQKLYGIFRVLFHFNAIL